MVNRNTQMISFNAMQCHSLQLSNLVNILAPPWNINSKFEKQCENFRANLSEYQNWEQLAATTILSNTFITGTRRLKCSKTGSSTLRRITIHAQSTWVQ